MWREIIALAGTVIASLGGFEFIKWLATRRANTRKAEAEAEKARADVGGDYIAMYERVMTTQAGQVESLMRQVYDHTNTIISLNATIIELKTEVSDLRVKMEADRPLRCEVPKCPNRRPPSEY